MSGDTSSSDDVQKKTGAKNSLGIPEAHFVEDVDEFMLREEKPCQATLVLKKLDEDHSKYKFMEQTLLQKKKRLRKQIPDIKSSLDILRFFNSRKDTQESLETQFMLSDQIYVKADVPPTDKVCLWLGANVMLEYSLDDAESLLTKNLNMATKNLAQLEDDLDFLRDQLTTTEVNMARVFNWDVKRRQAEKDKLPSTS